MFRPLSPSQSLMRRVSQHPSVEKAPRQNNRKRFRRKFCSVFLSTKDILTQKEQERGGGIVVCFFLNS